MYTTRLDDPDEVRDPDLALTAHMLQEWVEKSHDCRAIVVGDQVFTVAIRASSDAAHVDWRADYDALAYDLCDPPDDVRRGLVELHQQLGLTFGAVDLAVTTAGEWVFYETNPSGQYGWLVEECGLPVAEALADLLQEGRP